jgi:hypothetical protein
MPTMAYIEDDHMRFTILSGQPSGVACLKSGNFTKLFVFLFSINDLIKVLWIFFLIDV